MTIANHSKKRPVSLPMGKVLFLIGIVAVYIALALVFKGLIVFGIIDKSPPVIYKVEGSDKVMPIAESVIKKHLDAAKFYFESNFVEVNGHINLYIALEKNSDNDLITDQNNVLETIGVVDNIEDYNTNSEAASYYLLWTAQSHEKLKFDNQMEFIEQNMLQPTFGYMMWRLSENDSVINDGSNIASDADLRAIKALLLAEKQWGDPKYTKLIDKLAQGLEKVAITKDGYLAPYGGVSGESSTWTSDEVWLSYTDFTVIKELSKRRGQVWVTVYENMKQASIKAQLENGMYNSMLTTSRKYGNEIDGGAYSINSMWMMIQNAESKDKELVASAKKSLEFYKNRFSIDGELYDKYGSNGDALSPADTPWVYALVGRAAIELNDKEFSRAMMQKLLEKQIFGTNSSNVGAFPENHGSVLRVGQFTMQESILTMQQFVKKQY